MAEGVPSCARADALGGRQGGPIDIAAVGLLRAEHEVRLAGAGGERPFVVERGRARRDGRRSDEHFLVAGIAAGVPDDRRGITRSLVGGGPRLGDAVRTRGRGDRAAVERGNGRGRRDVGNVAVAGQVVDVDRRQGHEELVLKELGRGAECRRPPSAGRPRFAITKPHRRLPPPTHPAATGDADAGPVGPSVSPRPRWAAPGPLAADPDTPGAIPIAAKGTFHLCNFGLDFPETPLKPRQARNPRPRRPGNFGSTCATGMTDIPRPDEDSGRVVASLTRPAAGTPCGHRRPPSLRGPGGCAARRFRDS